VIREKRNLLPQQKIQAVDVNDPLYQFERFVRRLWSRSSFPLPRSIVIAVPVTYRLIKKKEKREREKPPRGGEVRGTNTRDCFERRRSVASVDRVFISAAILCPA